MGTQIGVILFDGVTEVGVIELGDAESSELGAAAREMGPDHSVSEPIGGGAARSRLGHGGGRGGGGRAHHGPRYATRGRPSFRHPPDHMRRPPHERHATFVHRDRQHSPEESDKFEKVAREGTGKVPFLAEQAALPEGAPGKGVGTEAKAEHVPTWKPEHRGPVPFPEGSGKDYLKRLRAPHEKELKDKPHFNRLASIASYEQDTPEGRSAVVQSLFNRATRDNKSLDELTRLGDSGSFYGPIRRGLVDERTVKGGEPISEKRREEILSAIAENTIAFRTDQGSPGEQAPLGVVTLPGSGEQYTIRPGDQEWVAARQREFEAAKQRTSPAGPEKFPGVATHDMPSGFGPTRESRAGALPRASAADLQRGRGGRAEFPTEANEGGMPQLRGVHPELISRVNAAYQAAKAAGARFSIISGYRPATRAEARAMGMSEHSSQEDIWQRSRGGTVFPAARPGHSRHQHGMAVDVRDPSGWLHRNAARFGLHFPVSGDRPHMEMIPDWRTAGK